MLQNTLYKSLMTINRSSSLLSSSSSYTSFIATRYISSSGIQYHGHSHGGKPCNGHHGGINTNDITQTPNILENNNNNNAKLESILQDIKHQAQPKVVSSSPSSTEQDKQQSNSKSISIKDLSSRSDLRYVSDRLKLCDYEGFICSILIANQGAKLTALAVRTFNVESIVDATLKQNLRHLAKYKLSFWKDAINNIYQGKVYDQPLIRVLAQQIKERNLSKLWFIKLLNRREKDLESIQLKDMEELEQYSDDIFTSVLMLTLEAMGIKGNSEVEHCASHLGKAMGIVTLIRGTPFHIRTRKLYIPASLTNKYDIVPELLFQGADPQYPKMKEAVFEMASQAKLHLDRAREFHDSIPKEARQVFLQAQICEDYLEDLRKEDFNVFVNLNTSNFIYLKLLKNKIFGKF